MNAAPFPLAPYTNIVDAEKEEKKKKKKKTLTDNAQATVEGHSGPTQCSAEI